MSISSTGLYGSATIVFKVFDFIELDLRSQKTHPQNPSIAELKSMAPPAPRE